MHSGNISRPATEKPETDRERADRFERCNEQLQKRLVKGRAECAGLRETIRRMFPLAQNDMEAAGEDGEESDHYIYCKIVVDTARAILADQEATHGKPSI